MKPRKVLLLAMAFTTMGTWAQGVLGNLPEVGRHNMYRRGYHVNKNHRW